MKILAIDPGNTESAYVFLDEDLRPVKHGKVKNDELLNEVIPECTKLGATDLAIEMVASYGMAVGRSVFETCLWAGQFWDRGRKIPYRALVYRMDEKMHLCNDSRAKDANIQQALIDRFAPDTPNRGKGTKKNPGFFYGFASDQWAAMAVGVTYAETKAGALRE